MMNALPVKLSIRVALVTILCVCAASAAFAQSFPTRSLTAIVAYGAGGGTDVAVRALTRYAREFIGVDINVENRTGGAGTVGMLATARARPDGYTIGSINFEILTYSHLNLAPISVDDYRLLLKVQDSPSAVTVQQDSPFQTLEELLVHARAHPGEVAIAASPPGSSWSVAAGAFTQAAGVEMNLIPYPGGAAAAVALLGGHVDLTTISVGEVYDHVRSGDLRILATMTAERHPLLPEVPTLRELGYDVLFGSFTVLAMPRSVPEDVFRYLEGKLKEMFDDPRFQQFANENAISLDYRAEEELRPMLTAQEQLVVEVLRSQDLIP